MDLNSNNFEAVSNFNATTDEKFSSGIKKNFIDNLKKLSVTSIICLIVFPLIFISIGIIYKNACPLRQNLTLFLIIFGLLILINLTIYTILGTTFIALIRRTRSLSFDKGIQIFIATLLAIIFSIIIFVWWIVGTIWWIKMTLHNRLQVYSSSSFDVCHPIVYWTALIANIFGLIGFIFQVCIAIGSTNQKQLSKNRGG